MRSLSASAGEPAAVAGVGVAGHVVRCRRREEDADALEVVRSAPASRGDAVEDRVVALLVGADRRGVRRRDVARGDRVDADAVLRELVRHQHRERLDAALRGRVARNEDAALEREHRGDVYDLSALALLEHLADDGLREEERRREVDRLKLINALK